MPRYAKEAKDTVWFELPSQHIFHVLNSWDIEGTNKVKLYACRYDDIDLNIAGKYDKSKESRWSKAKLCEYTFDLDTKEWEMHDESADFVEFPTINQNRFGH